MDSRDAAAEYRSRDLPDGIRETSDVEGGEAIETSDEGSESSTEAD